MLHHFKIPPGNPRPCFLLHWLFLVHKHTISKAYYFCHLRLLPTWHRRKNWWHIWQRIYRKKGTYLNISSIKKARKDTRSPDSKVYDWWATVSDWIPLFFLFLFFNVILIWIQKLRMILLEQIFAWRKEYKAIERVVNKKSSRSSKHHSNSWVYG